MGWGIKFKEIWRSCTTRNNNETVLEAEKRDGIPRGITFHIGEALSKGIKGKGSLDPVKILANGFSSYSEAPHYKTIKKYSRKVLEPIPDVIKYVGQNLISLPVPKELEIFYKEQLGTGQTGLRS